MATVRTAVVGVGHFGRYHAEKHSKLEDTDFIGVVDICADRARDHRRRPIRSKR